MIAISASRLGLQYSKRNQYAQKKASSFDEAFEVVPPENAIAFEDKRQCR
jgi:hypothetical protein